MSAAITEPDVTKKTPKQNSEKRASIIFDLNMDTPLKKLCGPERPAY
jgi:hypothetical protein